MLNGSRMSNYQKRLIVTLLAVLKRSIPQPTGNLGQGSARILDQYRFQRFQTQIAIVIINNLGHSVSKENKHVARSTGHFRNLEPYIAD